MPDTFVPTRDSDLLAFSANFSALTFATPLAYGVTVPQATFYKTLHGLFADALALTDAPSTRTKSKIQAKDDARDALVDGPGGLRELAAIVQAFPGTTNEMRVDLGLPVRDREPTPIPAPASAPVFIIKSLLGRTVVCRLGDANDSESRGKPEGVTGASVLMFVGDEAPENPMQWTLAKNVSKTQFELDLGGTVPGGSKVWLSAFWFNQKQENSAPATPVSVRVADTLAQAA